MKTVSSILPLLALLILPMFAHAFSMSSPAYQIDSAGVSSGGGNSASAGHGTAGATIGQSVLIGSSQVSAGYASKPLILPILSEQALIVSALVLAHTGDINGGGVVDIIDALLALKAGIGLVQLSSSELSRGDIGPLVNGVPVGDGRIDIEDAILILRKAVGLGW